MSPRVRTQHREVTAELAWSGSGSRSEITPAVGRTVHYPPPPLPNGGQTSKKVNFGDKHLLTRTKRVERVKSEF
ncbi:hypothetical protein Hanom_Chr16g01432271 [Helianthus anomalus]